MVMLGDAAQERVRETIREMETHTEMEFVAVLTRQSDGYYFIPTLWAAVIALFSPLLLLLMPLWLEAQDLVLMQLILFSGLTALFRFAPVMYRLVPRRVLEQRASNMAHRQFLEQGVHRTRDGVGVLFFVSEAEHFVEIIADTGIDARVSEAAWQQVVDGFTHRVREGRVEEGFVEAIGAVGQIGAQVLPAARNDNELPNHLIVIE